MSQWKSGVVYATDPSIRQKMSHYDMFFLLSDIEFKSKQGDNRPLPVDLFFETSSISFDEYVEKFHQRVYQLIYDDQNWMHSTCSCPYYMENAICKHIIAIALLKRDAVCPAEANPRFLNKKPKQGPKAKQKMLCTNRKLLIEKNSNNKENLSHRICFCFH